MEIGIAPVSGPLRGTAGWIILYLPSNYPLRGCLVGGGVHRNYHVFTEQVINEAISTIF